MMEGLASRSELRKEVERERRRIRDRQRRQSMSLEEREKHLARRRRNYQLRRQRAETARLNPPPPIQFQQTAISSIQLPSTNVPACVSDVSPPRFNADAAAASASASLVGSNHEPQRLMPDTRSSHCLEIPAHKLAILPQKVRLNRIKHLARAINDPVGDRVAIGGMIKANGASNGLISKGLRLNRVKRLARSLNPALQETVSQSHQSITEGCRKGWWQYQRSIIDEGNLPYKVRGCLEFRVEWHDEEQSHSLGLDFHMRKEGGAN